MTTRLADIIQPEIFTPYTVQKTMELSALIQSGIVENNSEFDELASGPNKLIHMPFWNDLGNNESQVMKDSGDMNVGKITSAEDIARKHARVNAWGANGLSALLSGDDPMAAIGNLVANYWARDMQRTLLATLSGIFKSNSMSDKVLDITNESGTDSLLDGDSFIDAGQLMGDAKELLTGVMMHSAVEAYLAKRQLIEYVQEAGQSDRVPYFMTKRVIVDDAMPYDTSTGVGEIYLFGNGAIALGNGSHTRIIETEVTRNALAFSGEEALVNRKIFILHPRGVKWNEAGVANEFPTNAEIDVAARWTRVYEPKAVRIVKCRFNTKVPAGSGD